MYHVTRKVLFGAMVSASAFGMAFYSPANAAPLEDTVQQVVRDNPAILEAAANRRATDQELRQARGLYWPQVDMELAGGREWSLNSTTRARTGRSAGDSAGVWQTRAESRITLQQVLFDGFARDSEVERQAARVDASAKRVRERSEFIALDLVESYLDNLRHQSLIDLATENVKVHERHLSNVRDRARSGQSGVGDVHQAQARLADARGTLIESKRDLDKSRNMYIRVVGGEPKDLSRPRIDASALPSNVSVALKESVTNNPTLILAQADIDISRSEIAASGSSLWPTVKLELGASRNARLDGSNDVNHDASAMLRMQYNIYRGGIDRAKKNEYLERLSESRERMLKLRRLVEEETRQSWNAMVRATERLDVLKDQEVANAQVVATYRQGFQVGQRDLVDVLDAENELFTTRVRRVTSEYVALFGGYRLFASTGKLLSTLGVSLTKEATSGMRDRYGRTPENRWEMEIPEDQRSPN